MSANGDGNEDDLRDMWMSIPHEDDTSSWSRMYGAIGRIITNGESDSHTRERRGRAILSTIRHAVECGFTPKRALSDFAVVISAALTIHGMSFTNDGPVMESPFGFLLGAIFGFESVRNPDPISIPSEAMHGDGPTVDMYCEANGLNQPFNSDAPILSVDESGCAGVPDTCMMRPLLLRSPHGVIDVIESFLAGISSDGFTDAAWAHDPDTIHWRGRTASVLGIALSRLAELGVDVVHGESATVGRALATAWSDALALCDGESPMGVFTSYRMLARWRRAVSTRRGIPACATTMDNLRWLFRYGTPTYMADPKRPGCVSAPWLVDCGDVVDALECGDAPDYSVMRRLARSRGCIPVPGHEPDGFAWHGNPINDAIWRSATPAQVIGALRMADALVVVAGGNPDCPRISLPKGRRVGHAHADAAFRRAIPFLSGDGVDALADALERGLPLDMAAHLPFLRHPGFSLDEEAAVRYPPKHDEDGALPWRHPARMRARMRAQS